MVLCAAICWAFSGIAAQLFFQHFISTPGLLVSIRLLSAGSIMILLQCLFQGSKSAFSVWSHKKDRLTLLVFGFIGMLGVQYTFFAAIHHGNAATATLLQYLGPIFIIVFVSLRLRRRPGSRELIAFLLALIGIFFMTTSGSIHSLTITKEAFSWGIISALAAAFYTLYPAKLLKAWGPVSVVGWSMIIGGIGLSMFHPPWQFDWSQGSLLMFFMLAFIVLIGTITPFYLFLDSLRFVTPAQASILGSAEPLTAVLVTTVFLHTPMDLIQLLGSLCIIVSVLVLAFRSARKDFPGNHSTAV
ncbi:MULTISPECIES: DMT family transporter [unclassified Paenibacillus]|uniref:DMT family transporter n=1 Tax=unclassified Paenibacillus TaxID=185978 RepID=UPI001B58E467|nr:MULTISPECIES: DMT family transporter [unclassified Paenibacillus]MBP1157027.1 drug/metabolite transporter (DMT)-like permease [Paenibacillus sp. PvP091]MBP1172234.1 drug/metabolite transporter (DMT)-like permease [Paenibacillus sp. PvR098]MBP2438615.1 drug/metabolite transporter (DMT)-like permease [Paenibacillus sp. PvP052]